MPTNTDPDLNDGIRELRALIDEGNVLEAVGVLQRLRGRWTKQPSLFDGDTVAELRDLAARLADVRSQALDGMLADTFGFDSFRPGQREIVESALDGRDCIGIMPTGAGKSLTYQLAARALGGTTLVISPLIALMKDQVDGLGEAGMRATFLNSTL
ncbi:MAG: DEAD/DEAH box helicase, partial [Gammaproteobacteria bacterium]|nr:DEAD/DEAH box helicase [Gammaproteobacteria bacterium]